MQHFLATTGTSSWLVIATLWRPAAGGNTDLDDTRIQPSGSTCKSETAVRLYAATQPFGQIQSREPTSRSNGPWPTFYKHTCALVHIRPAMHAPEIVTSTKSTPSLRCGALGLPPSLRDLLPGAFQDKAHTHACLLFAVELVDAGGGVAVRSRPACPVAWPGIIDS